MCHPACQSNASCCQPLKWQGPVETCPEMGVRRNTTEGCLGQQQSLEEAGCSESCFTQYCSSTGPLWFVSSDAFLCYCLKKQQTLKVWFGVGGQFTDTHFLGHTLIALIVPPSYTFANDVLHGEIWPDISTF